MGKKSNLVISQKQNILAFYVGNRETFARLRKFQAYMSVRRMTTSFFVPRYV